MERCGTRADKAKHKRLFQELYAREERWKRTQRGGRSAASASNSNAALQRFKFWLGLPNSYYTSEWRNDDD
jgi:hypothetical protein